ncbi:MAG: hypothetical protein IRY97_02595, partial [Thermomicrobiaceae bacterium]|nr:hypothetical protein [Thermomicrobiaceae bacterium]
MWARIASALLGIWLMAAPSVLAYHGVARTNDRIVGPIAASLSAIAAWEVTRSLRYADLVVGFWLLAAPVVLGYPVTPALNSLVVGLALIGLSFLGGRTRQRVG